jgi:hypothetical protein
MMIDRAWRDLVQRRSWSHQARQAKRLRRLLGSHSEAQVLPEHWYSLITVARWRCTDDAAPKASMNGDFTFGANLPSGAAHKMIIDEY